MKRLSILLLLVFAVGGTTASAQDKYPSKPIKVVVPFGPGSATDIVMRIVGEQMRPILGQPVLVENKPGAFGILAIARAYAKANPGKVRYASVGVGSNNHYDMEAFAKWAGIVLTHLPNKGGGAAITNDLVTGDAHVALLNAASSMGVVKAGQVRALAVMSDKRVPEYADVPTLMELGYPNAKGLWSALYAPAATPRDVLEVVRKAAVQALGSEQVETAFRQQMIRALPSASIEEAQAWNKAELAYWKKVTDEVRIDLPD